MNIIYDKIVDQINSWYLYLATNEVNHEEEIQIQAGIAELDKALSYFPSPRTEQDVLKDFEALGYEVVTNNEIGIILDFKTALIENGFVKNHYMELERININKRTKSYKKDHIEKTNGHQVISDKTWFSIQEHKLLNELFTIWGWI